MSSMFKEMEFQQPTTFSFSAQNMEVAKKIMQKYPENTMSAVMPLLYLAQKQHDNWIPRAAMDCIAQMIDIPPIKVYEVASFYTMYNKQPVGRNLIQVCRTTPCWLRGSDDIMEACKSKLGIESGETTVDGAFTLVEVECLGACVNAPVVQITNDTNHYYENLTKEQMEELLDSLA